MIIIYGENMVFGRLASQVSKKLLAGEEVHIINSEKIIFTGNPDYLKNRYLQKRRLQNKACPEHSPKWPRVPNMFVKRLLRGMLPWKKARGKAAFERLFVYAGNPKKLKSNIHIENARFDVGQLKYITVKELCRGLGYES